MRVLDEATRKMIKAKSSKGGALMAVSAQPGESSFERYIAEIRSVWGGGKDPELPFKVKALMEKMLKATPRDEPWIADLIREAKPSRELYRDPDFGFIQMGHVHQQTHGNMPHDHGPCWVVYGSYSGLTEITLYRRTDDGNTPGRATLEKKDLHRLSPGVAHAYVPGDIHSTRAVEGPAVVFRFLSYDLEKIQRHRYNLEKGTVVPV
jgi:hypothetical protein